MENDAPAIGLADVIIIGGGPAGLSAAVNAKARNLNAIVLDAHDPASKLRAHPEITNYLGMPNLEGPALADRFAAHFALTGFRLIRERAQKILPMGENLCVGTDKEIYDGRTIVLALGVAQAKLLPGEERLLGKGVHYCVTCDGALYAGRDVIVAGYIREGEEEANALAGFARSVRYVSTYEDVGPLESGIEVIHAKPEEILGEEIVSALKTDVGELRADGVFVVREAMPIGSMLEGLSIKDNFIEVDASMATSFAGVFAAGDCTGPPYQIAKAVGQGQVAALSAARHIYKTRKKE